MSVAMKQATILKVSVAATALVLAALWFLTPSIRTLVASGSQAARDSSSSAQANVVALPPAVRASGAAVTSSSDVQPKSSAAGSAESVWIEIQRTKDLRGRIAQAAVSNDPREAAAALNASLYCSHIANTHYEGDLNSVADRVVTRFPSDSTVVRSALSVRAERIRDARNKCSFRDDDDAKRLDGQLRARIAQTLSGLNDLARAASNPPTIDLSSLSAAQKASLASGEIYVRARVVDQLTTKLPRAENIAEDSDIAALLATHVAMCRMGDSCESGSFRADHLCVLFGACEGANAEDSVRVYLSKRQRDLTRTDDLANLVVNQIQQLAAKP